MIKIDKEHFEISGNEVLILSELGATVKKIAELVGKDRVAEICLIGLYAHGLEDMMKIDEILKERGFDV